MQFVPSTYWELHLNHATQRLARVTTPILFWLGPSGSGCVTMVMLVYTIS